MTPEILPGTGRGTAAGGGGGSYHALRRAEDPHHQPSAGSLPCAGEEFTPDTEYRGVAGLLPPFLRDLWLLARFDRPIGAWLLFWPGAWAILLAWPGWTEAARLILLFGVGAVAMRGAGCVYNDIVDRELDRRVARTRARPLASGRISLSAAWAWLAALGLAGLGVLALIGDLATALLAIASLALVAAYPFMKRITWWPQAWLGLVFSWAAPVGWVAALPVGAARLTADTLAPGLWLYAGSILWVIGYDTIYALQDIEDDALAGVRSSALALGRHARLGVAVCYGLAPALWAIAFWSMRPQWLTVAALVPMALHLGWQLAALRPADPADALAKFRSNRFAGLLMALACLVVGIAATL